MQSSLFTPIDIYCERLDPGFWAEPLNALSNASFLVAAWFAWRLASNGSRSASIQERVLITLMAIIGAGSFLFHTLAAGWAMLADVIPIFVYQVLFLVFYMHKVARLTLVALAIWLLVFIAASVGFGALPTQWLNGSLSYAHALIFIAGTGCYHYWAQKSKPWALLVASAIFTVSLFFRSIDMAVCNHLSIGTHSIWHLLNGVVLYLTVRAYVAKPSSAIETPHSNAAPGI